MITNDQQLYLDHLEHLLLTKYGVPYNLLQDYKLHIHRIDQHDKENRLLSDKPV